MGRNSRYRLTYKVISMVHASTSIVVLYVHLLWPQNSASNQRSIILNWKDALRISWVVEVSKLFLLKYVIITTVTTATVTITTITIWFFEYCHDLTFLGLSPIDFFSFITVWGFFSFVTIFYLKVLSQFEFLSLVTIWVLSFIIIWIIRFCHKWSFWVLSQYDFF